VFIGILLALAVTAAAYVLHEGFKVSLCVMCAHYFVNLQQVPLLILIAQC
jgi:hypothetical protein